MRLFSVSLCALALLLAPTSALGQEAPPQPAEPAAPARRSENPLTAAPKPDEPAKPTGQLTKAPELLQFVNAVYPKQAEEQGLAGSVGLVVDIDETGAVTKAEVTEPAGNGFDEAALEAVKQFRFSPAEIDGKPAPVRIAYRYNFTLTKKEVPPPPKEEIVTLRGKILQRGNRQPVGSASIAVDDGAFGTTCDEKGLFQVAGVLPGKHRIVVTAVGFDRFESAEDVVEGAATEVVYYVHKSVFTPYETVVRGKREEKEVARVELKQEEIRLIAGTGGDAFRVVQDLPGVARTPYSFGLLIVRGGRPNDTRVYVDGVWIPIIFHFAGLTAVYNSDLLQDLDFLPGNFSAHDGRAMGGVVEAETRTPSKDAYHGYANVSLIDSTLFFEGPLSENWSGAVSGRISYVDLVLKEFLPSTVQFITAPRYWDYQLKFEYAPKGSKDRVVIQGFGSHDLLELLLTNPAMIDPEGRNNISAADDFERLMMSWTHTFQPGVRNKLTMALGLDTVSSSVGSDLSGTLYLYGYQLRDSLELELHKALSLNVGTDSFIGWYKDDVTRPPLPLLGEVPDPIVSRQLERDTAHGIVFEPGLFAEAIWKPFTPTKIIPGVRLDYEATLKYVTVDPRLSVFQEVHEGTVLKGAVGIYQQPPDYTLQQWTPTFGNPNLGPERSVSSMIGVEQKITDAIGLDVQLYYKWMWNLEWPSTATVERDGQEVLERYNNSGLGRCYGIEILLRHQLTSRFFGWISYSYSRSERRSPLAADPTWHNAQFDQPHHLVAVASYKWPYDFVTGARFQYVSGNLSTPINSSVYDSDADLNMPIPGTAWSVRGPDFVSLDLRVDKRFVFQDWSLNVFLDVQNVTDNKNGEFVYYNYDYTKTQYVRGMPIFPSVGIKAEF